MIDVIFKSPQVATVRVQIFSVATKQRLCRSSSGKRGHLKGGNKMLRLEAGAPPNSPTGAWVLVRFLLANFTQSDQRFPEAIRSHRVSALWILFSFHQPFVGPFCWRAAWFPHPLFSPLLFFAESGSSTLSLFICPHVNCCSTSQDRFWDYVTALSF